MSLSETETNIDEPQALESSDGEGELETLPTNVGRDLKGRELTFKHATKFRVEVCILEGQSQLYFAQICSLGKKPDVILHSGLKDGPVLAAAHYRWGRDVIVGLGQDELSMTWYAFKRCHPFIEKRGFTFEWQGSNYLLQRATSSDHKATGAGRFLLTHFKVVEEATGELVALYVSQPTGKTKATLKMKAGMNEELQLLCIVGVVSWRDKIRRR
ncbi:hypothetical protein LTR09_001072 [Extremus antarcticus]|uniref:Uncharacterized protein n=1 Tax=Extremus antarcticus TaxID=702011 RepID=A0AAJ0LWD9_9PEZI|nr:hypothetical protein LTR09_001072 [Extremus antarcticus]